MNALAARGENQRKLLDAMRSLTISKGFSATTVEQVCAKANVSKGSFYHYFASKEAIGHAVLDDYFAELVDALTSGPVDRNAGAVERLRAFFTHAGDTCSGPLLSNGCILGSLTLDLAASHPDVRVKLSNQFTELAQLIANLLVDAATAVGIELPSARLAQQFLAIIEGSIVLSKAHADPQLLGSGVALFAEHIDLLLEGGTVTHKPTPGDIDVPITKQVLSVSLPVENQDRALRFYTEVLGFELRTDVEVWPGARLVKVAPPGSSVGLVLLPPDSEIPMAVRMATDDAQAAYDHLQSSGATLNNDAVLDLDGLPPMFSFRDPDGNGLVFIQETSSDR